MLYLTRPLNDEKWGVFPQGLDAQGAFFAPVATYDKKIDANQETWERNEAHKKEQKNDNNI